MTERVAFFLKFMLEPKKIGSVTPSSNFLTRYLFKDLAWPEIALIVELGAGTGVFTRAIAEQKPAMCQVVVIEQDTVMRQVLQRSYPDFSFGMKAEQLEEFLQGNQLGQADCIVSGLPFAVFDAKQQSAVLTAVCRSLKQDGIFIAFQYSLQLYPVLKQYFREVKVGFVLLNLPPAFVYFCKR